MTFFFFARAVCVTRVLDWCSWFFLTYIYQKKTPVYQRLYFEFVIVKLPKMETAGVDN